MNELTNTDLMIIMQMINGGTFSGKHLEIALNLKTKIQAEIDTRKEIETDNVTSINENKK